jgi:hypothetical protein
MFIQIIHMSIIHKPVEQNLAYGFVMTIFRISKLNCRLSLLHFSPKFNIKNNINQKNNNNTKNSDNYRDLDITHSSTYSIYPNIRSGDLLLFSIKK